MALAEGHPKAVQRHADDEWDPGRAGGTWRWGGALFHGSSLQGLAQGPASHTGPRLLPGLGVVHLAVKKPVSGPTREGGGQPEPFI